MKNLINQLYGLMDSERYNEARKIIEHNIDLVGEEQLFFKIQLHAMLIDIGNESQNEDDLKKGAEFFERNQKNIEEIIGKSSYCYNLANAKSGLVKIFYSQTRSVPTLSIVKEKLQEPISLYWMAYKAIDLSNTSLLSKILINLSNSLVKVGRIVEGLQFLDVILREFPNYPQALISRGDNLDYLIKVTNCSTSVALYYQIYEAYERGIKTNQLPFTVLKRSEEFRSNATNKVEEYGFNISGIDKEIAETQKEYNSLSEFRKFSLDNFLTVNEHALYCSCIASEKDNLQIGVPHAIFKGEIVPKLELLLNRIKSEFAFARWQYFKSNTEKAFDYDVKFSELLDGEVINSQSELLRTSYRICYGILDKIALGICKLYNVDSDRIFFETFWKNPNRHKVLNDSKNIHLKALYSIACDLNTQTGELKHFKNWRNKLEHNLLILKNKDEVIPDLLWLFTDKDFVTVVDIEEFKQKTIQLLQVTRAAIFSFVYCVRLETIQSNSNDNENSFIIDFKS